MKRAVSISLGSSKRDKAVEVELLGEAVRVAAASRELVTSSSQGHSCPTFRTPFRRQTAEMAATRGEWPDATSAG